MKSERITVRVTEDEKKEISVVADKVKMNTSEYVYTAVMDRMQVDKLNDSQGQFLKLFDTSFKKSFDPYQKHFMVVLNRIEFNVRWMLREHDIFMQNLKIPQTKDTVVKSIISHPIVEIAKEDVLKDIRTMSSKKRELEDE